MVRVFSIKYMGSVSAKFQLNQTSVLLFSSFESKFILSLSLFTAVGQNLSGRLKAINEAHPLAWVNTINQNGICDRELM